MALTKQQASSIASAHGFTLTGDFHALASDTVERIIAAANTCNYRQPRNANGSRARYFYARLRRAYNSARESE